MLPETNMKRLRDEWVVEAPAPDLADRIAAHALAHKQRRPFFAGMRLPSFAFPERRVAMGGFAVAACIMIAIVALQSPVKKNADGTAYSVPLDQVVDEMMWNDYTY